LVSAPARFGKTTLLAGWLGNMQGDDCRIAWVSLDAADSDPASFWIYVMSALQAAVPGVGSSALAVMASSAVATESALTAVLNDLASAPTDVRLVLDDYHLVESQDVGKGLVFLLEHLPPNMHVVISTRADPELPVSRLHNVHTPKFAFLRGHLVIELPGRAKIRRYPRTQPGQHVTGREPALNPLLREVQRTAEPSLRWQAAPTRCRVVFEGPGPCSLQMPPAC
jgi:hypothetical protein